MEHNNLYKQLLQNASEKASPSFTSSVMAAVRQAAKPVVYQPLVAPVVKRIFISVFISVVALIFILCLFIAISGIHFSWSFNLPQVSQETFKQTTIAILLFWALFAANYLAAGSNKLLNGM